MITKIVILILLLVSLSSCQMGNSIPILTATTYPTPTDIPRWQLYEAALLEATIGEDKEGLCEWTILGVTGNEVYVYTLCQATGRIKTAMSVPAVVYLRENGAIEGVLIPRPGIDYPKDVESLFPPEVQDIIYGRKSGGIASSEHLRARIENSGPPLIVVLGTPMP
jgi:hypothetical protein